METYPTKGHTAYHIHLTDENLLFYGLYYPYYKVIRKDNKKEYCLGVTGSGYRDRYDKDVKILLEANHPFIVNYIDHFTTDKEGLCIVTDCISSQTLYHLVYKEEKILS